MGHARHRKPWRLATRAERLAWENREIGGWMYAYVNGRLRVHPDAPRLV